MIGAYDDEIATALELIAEAGQVCSWYKDQPTGGDPDRPWIGHDNIPIIYQPSIVFIPATAGASSFGITKFKEGDADFSTFGLMGAVPFVPEPRDRVLRGTVPLVVVAVDKLQPAEDVLLYVLSIE